MGNRIVKVLLGPTAADKDQKVNLPGFYLVE